MLTNNGIVGIHYYVGMAGKDELSNAILGGASDYIADITAKIIQWYQAKDEDKVLCCIHVDCVNYTYWDISPCN